MDVDDSPRVRLLREVLEEREPHLLPCVEALQERLLTPEERRLIRNLLAEKLVETGLGQDDEPNERGVLLEDLTDWLRYRSSWALAGHGELSEQVRADIEELLRAIASRYDHATVQTSHLPHFEAPDLKLECSLPGTAAVAVYVLEGDIDLLVGQATGFDFVRTDEDDGVLHGVGALVDAVTRGMFEETLWRVGDRVVRSRGVARVAGGRKMRSSRTGLVGWVFGGRKRHTRYAPYG